MFNIFRRVSSCRKSLQTRQLEYPRLELKDFTQPVDNIGTYEKSKNAGVPKGVPETGCTVLNHDTPPDLQRVIEHWASLPKSIKKAILALVKANRKKQKSER